MTGFSASKLNPNPNPNPNNSCEPNGIIQPIKTRQEKEHIMKNILIFGASGSLAQVVLKEAEHLTDVHWTLFVRDKRRLTQSLSQRPNTATVIEGDALKPADVTAAIQEQDIVYVNLAGDLRPMTENIVHAMYDQDVKRIIAISAIGIYNDPPNPAVRAYRELADAIEASGLDYTILRSDWFTNSQEIDYALTHKGEPETGSAISRRSIASFVCQLFAQPDTHVRENLGISKPD